MLNSADPRKYCQSPTGQVDGHGGPFIRQHTSSFDGSVQPYAMYVPDSYSADRQWPLVISLHGYSSDHILNLRRLFGRGTAPDEPECKAKVCFPTLPQVEFLAASPYAFGSIWYDGPAETEVLDVLADVRANYSIDPDRIFLTGISMGGAGAWHIASRYPDRFAAIAPVCGPANYRLWDRQQTEYADEISALNSPVSLAPNLCHTPAFVSHGDADDVVSVEHSRQMVARLRELGCHVEYEEQPGVGHNAWDIAYADARMFRWFQPFRLSRRPRFIDFRTPMLRWPKAWWVRIEGMQRRPAHAVVRAEVTGPNVLDVATDNVSALTILAGEAPVDLDRDVVVRWNGREVYRGSAHPEILLGEQPGPGAKRRGLEGPVADAFRDRYLLVYGTQGDDAAAIEAGRKAAESSADPGEWGDIVIPVKADVDVTDDDVRDYNLVLFGNPQTNSIILSVNGLLPVRFEGEWVAAGRRLLTGHDMGLVVVYPSPRNRSRYVVIVGGTTAAAIAVAAENYRSAPDYLVFDGSSDFSDESTLREWGYFGEDWKIATRSR